MLILRKPWKSQPPGPAPLITLPVGSAVWTPPGGVAGGLPAVPVSTTMLTKPNRGGMAVEATAASSRIAVASLSHVSADIGMTWVWQGINTTATTVRYCSGTVSTGTSYIEDVVVNKNALDATDQGRVQVHLREVGVNNVSRAASTDVVMTAYKLHTICWQWQGAGNFRLWVDGAEKAVTVNLSAYVATAVAGLTEFPTVLMNRNVRNAFTNGANGFEMTMWARIPGVAMSGASLSQNPWQLFAPRVQYIPTSVAAAGYTHPTLSAATATEIGATSFKPRVTYEFV